MNKKQSVHKEPVLQSWY